MALPVGVAVRRGRPGDALAVLRLLEQAGCSPDARGFDETFAQVVRHPEAAVFIATDGPRVVGYLALSHRPLIHLGGRHAIIDELIVDPLRRGEGIGGALVEHALVHVRGLGCLRVALVTARSHESYARGFYLGHSFVEDDAAVMQIDLARK